MSSEAIWQDICPCCEGTGQIGIWRGPRRPHIKQIGKEETLKCDACNGTGKILICKKIRKGK